MSEPTKNKEQSVRPQEFDFEPITVSKNGWRVTLSYHDEGYYGKFMAIKDKDHAEMADDPCLRLSIYERINGSWNQIPNGTFLSYLRPTDPQNILIDAVKIVVNECIDNPEKPFSRQFIYKLATIHVARGEARLLPNFGAPVGDDE